MAEQDQESLSLQLAQLVGVIEAHRDGLIKIWKENLRMTASRATPILKAISRDIEEGRDLLSFFYKSLKIDSGGCEDCIPLLTNRVLTQEYSISDLRSEIVSLGNSFASLLASCGFAHPETTSLANTVRSLLSRIFQIVIEQTVGVYQYAVEHGRIAFCQLDPAGMVLFANYQMEALLGGPTAVGAKFADFFEGDDRDFVINAISGGQDREPLQGQLEIIRGDGTSVPVWASIEVLSKNSTWSGAYAFLTQILAVVAREEKFLDQIKLPTIKLDRKLRITYANAAALDLLGTSDIRGMSAADVFPRDQKMAKQLDKRRAGEGDVYETEIARRLDGKKVPVSVAGIPIMDDNNRFIGAFGIIRSLKEERISEAIHKHMEVERDEKELIKAVAEEVNKLVPFDYFGVTQYSRNSQHFSSWIRYTRDQKPKLTRRWRPILPSQKDTIGKPKIITDLVPFLVENGWENYAEDSDIKTFVEQGYKSGLSFPVFRRGRMIASVSLWSKQKARYTEADRKRLQNLPVEQAIQMAFYYRNQRDSRFRYDLIKDMIKLSTAKQLADLLASRLSTQYQWHHVAVFKVCRPERKFRLLAEMPASRTSSLPPEFHEQPLNKGILGHVYKTRKARNVSDTSTGELANTFLQGWPEVRSELCLPIIWDDKVQWILDLEDERLDAFSTEEEEILRIIVDEAAFVLRRLSRQYLLESAFQFSSDALLITDNRGTILEANPAAEKLLGNGSPGSVRGRFRRLFKDKRVAKAMLRASQTRGTEVELVRSDGTGIPVWMSGTDLPEDLSQKIFIAKDLSVLQRLERLEALKKLFEEVALQTHTPLALANTWLRNLKGVTKDQPVSEQLTKILAQLKKLEITYDRLALLSVGPEGIAAASRKQALDLGVEVKRTLEEFPNSEQRRIKYHNPDKLPYLQCDPTQVSFIISTILSYCLRLSPPDFPIDVSLHRAQTAISLTCSALLPTECDTAGSDRSLSRASFDMALGEPVIQEFSENNCGKYERSKQEPGRVQFRIDFMVPSEESTGS